MEELTYDHVWSVNTLKRQHEGERVTAIHWEVNSTYGEHTARRYGSVSLDLESSVTVPYEALTIETVLEWVYSLVGREETEAAQEAAINAKLNADVSGTPW